MSTFGPTGCQQTDNIYFGLSSTHPHHNHIPPDLKRNRIAAPNMSFLRPNLPALIHEIEGLIETLGSEAKKL